MAQQQFAAGVLRVLYHALPTVVTASSALGLDPVRNIGKLLARLLQLDSNTVVDAVRNALTAGQLAATVDVVGTTVAEQLAAVEQRSPSPAAEGEAASGPPHLRRLLWSTWAKAVIFAGVRCPLFVARRGRRAQH